MPPIEHIEHQWITMADGVRLSARTWIPAQSRTNPVPAILEYIPYRKRDMVRIRDERNHPVFAQAGYASLRVDMRGSGDSEGTRADMYCPEELADAISVIEWIADQAWCDGNVGMMGTSWGGTSSLQAASRRPAALKAIIAVCATNNRYDDDIHHMGGCLLTDSIEWGATLPAILASPPDPLTVGYDWRDIWQHRLEKLSFPLEHWIAHETRDDYWKWGSVNEKPEAITCPVLMIGGWSDRYSNTVLNFLEQSHDNCWGIVGGWGHHYPDQANPEPGIAFQQEAIRWWDHWLRNIDNNINNEPRLKVWMQEYCEPADAIGARPGQWVTEKSWPSSNIEPQHYYIDHSSLRQSAACTAMVSEIPGGLSIASASGDTGYFGRSGGLPLDQSQDDSESLVFETEPLKYSIDVLGSAELDMALICEEKVSTVIARLNDVHPNGQVARVSYAVKNLTLNQNCTNIGTQNSDANKHVTLPLHNTAYRFEKGHRIRLALSTSYWPIIWPSPTLSKTILSHDDLKLTLPVRKKINNETETAFENSTIPEQISENNTAYEVRSAPALKRWHHNGEDGASHEIHWHQPHYSVFFPSINLEFGFATTACHKITENDPTSAASRFEHTLFFSRDDWRVKVNSVADVTATKTHFMLNGKIIITEDDEIIFTRQWNPTIKRRCS